MTVESARGGTRIYRGTGTTRPASAGASIVENARGGTRVLRAALGVLNSLAGAPAEQVTETFLGLWRLLLERTECRMGCAVLAVTVATDSAELLDRAGTVFRSWRTRLAELLEQGGLTGPEAAAFAVTLVASAEGAVVLSRAERSMEPFDAVAGFLLSQLPRRDST